MDIKERIPAQVTIHAGETGAFQTQVRRPMSPEPRDSVAGDVEGWDLRGPGEYYWSLFLCSLESELALGCFGHSSRHTIVAKISALPIWELGYGWVRGSCGFCSCPLGDL